VAKRLQILEMSPPIAVEGDRVLKARDLFRGAAAGEVRPHGVGVLPDEANVEHGSVPIPRSLSIPSERPPLRRVTCGGVPRPAAAASSAENYMYGESSMPSAAYGTGMGMTHVRISVAKDLSGATRTLRVLVDSGAVYSIFPRRVLASLAVRPIRKEAFRAADGREIVRDVGMVVIRCQGIPAATQVIFGEPGDASVLGVVALEELGLELDARSGRLRKAELLLLRLRAASSP